MSDSRLKWGIVGCANIAKKNVKAIQGSQNNLLVAVGSRNLEHCNTWVSENAQPGQEEPILTYGTYDEVINNTSVEAIYLPTPTTTHLDLIRRIVTTGKHILCEKPVATSVEELQNILRICKENNVQFMDGVMFVHHERMDLIQKELFAIHALSGDLDKISSKFSFPGTADFFKNNVRISQNGDPLGCLGDLGWYNIRFAMYSFACNSSKNNDKNDLNGNKSFVAPYSARCVNAELNDNNVCVELNAEVYFDKEKTKKISFFNSFKVDHQQVMEVTFSDGNKLTCNDFVLPRDPEGNDKYTTIINGVEKVHAIKGCIQEQNMFTNFSHLVKEKKAVDFYFYNLTMVTQCVVNAILNSMHNNYENVIIEIPEEYGI